MRFRPFLLSAVAVVVGCHSPPSTPAAPELPVVVITRDDTVISRSCRVRVPAGTIISDTNGNGVIQIGADGVTVRFEAGSELRGATAGTDWDRLQGIGIRIANHRGVILEGAHVHGFKNGLVASRAEGLTVAGGDFSDNYRQRLRSTPAAEDGADWLYPHHNDDTRWRDEYGGAVCVEESARVTIRDITVRRGQNGIILDRVDDSAVYDNDCSFLSGWGLALWRSNRNTISRNAFDFCVRGHVEGVYNRGQDSAGILCFEQCSENVFAENSVTHGGDGFFGFAGREAIGELWMDRERERLRKETGRQDVDGLIQAPPALAQEMSARGCNRNLLVGNDFSYAPAHGIEMTFSEGNQFIGNRLVENAICGIWGGYSSGTLIVGNDFVGNGGMAYGLERGAINMEHAAENLVVSNRFLNNKCTVHLWWNDNPDLMRLPGVAGTERGVTGNVIFGNRIEINRDAPFANLGASERLVVLQLRSPAPGRVTNNAYAANQVILSHPQAAEFALEAGCAPVTNANPPAFSIPTSQALGQRHPVGARSQLRGRSQILMDEWGPWDHASPLVRPAHGGPGEQVFELFGVPGLKEPEVLAGQVTATLERGEPARLRLRGPPGVASYRVRVRGDGFTREWQGTLVTTEWRITVFPWAIDPRKDLAAWRGLATGPEAISASARDLDFAYGWGGPRTVGLSEEITRRGPGNDHFGMIATTRLRLPAGRWRFKTLSDDGVRVQVNGRPVVENWTWHGPTNDEGVLVQEKDAEVEVLVEHFEIDGFATLRVELEPVSEPSMPGS